LPVLCLVSWELFVIMGCAPSGCGGVEEAKPGANAADSYPGAEVSNIDLTANEAAPRFGDMVQTDVTVPDGMAGSDADASDSPVFDAIGDEDLACAAVPSCVPGGNDLTLLVLEEPWYWTSSSLTRDPTVGAAADVCGVTIANVAKHWNFPSPQPVTVARLDNHFAALSSQTFDGMDSTRPQRQKDDLVLSPWPNSSTQRHIMGRLTSAANLASTVELSEPVTWKSSDRSNLAALVLSDGTYMGSAIPSAHTVLKSSGDLPILVRWDAAGSLLWAKAVPVALGTEIAAYTHAAALVGDHVVAAGTYGTKTSWIVSATLSGQVDWSSTKSIGYVDIVKNLASAGNKVLVIGLNESVDSLVGAAALVDAAGQITWSRRFGLCFEKEMSLSTHMSASVDLDNVYIISSSSWWDSSIVLSQIKLSGEVIFVRRLLEQSNNEDYWSIVRGATGLALAGLRATLGEYEPVQGIVRVLDRWGNATCAESGPCANMPLSACDDANPATMDLCDAAHGGCYHLPGEPTSVADCPQA